MSSCYTDLCRKVNSLLLRVTSLESLMHGGEDPMAFFFNVTGGSSSGDISGGFAQVGPAIDETLNLWSSGGLAITVTDGSAQIRIEPSNVSEAFTTAGAPSLPPKDATRPAIHLASDGLYFWAPSTATWVLISAIGAGDDWGSQVVVSDATLAGTGVTSDPLRVVGGTGGDLSTSSCNGLRLDPTDSKLFVEDQGYQIARTFAELETLVNSGQSALVCSQLVQTVDATLGSQGDGVNIRFVLAGSIDTQGFTLIIHSGVENPRNRPIFFGYVLDETYPARVEALGSTVRGTFGGNPNRDTRWWGLTTSLDPNNAPLSQAQLNNNAIVGAALSQSTAGKQVLVSLPQGDIPIYRPVRLDGLKATLYGPGMNLARLWVNNNNWVFDVSHFILTADYTVNGSTPIVQIGYERVPGTNNNDEGFFSRVDNLSIIGPLSPNLPARRVSGIMWESGLQEGSGCSFVHVANYGGYAIGGPRKQHLSHNPVDGAGNYAPASNYMQLNTVRFDNLWIFTPVYLDAIGMSVFGINFAVNVATVAHNNPPGGGGMSRPAIITGSRKTGRWSNIHIEQSWLPDAESIGVHVTDSGNVERMSFDTIGYRPTNPIGVGDFGTTAKLITLRVDAARGGITAQSITNIGNYVFSAGTSRAIVDGFTGKESAGYHNTVEQSPDYVATYSRQMKANIPQICTSDPALELGTVFPYDPPPLLAGAEDITADIPVTFARFGDHLEITFDQSLQGVELDGWVSTSGNVKARFRNNTVGTIDLAAGNIKIRLKKM